MPTPISKEQWDQMVAEHGEQEAGQLAQEDGLYLANEDGTPYQPDEQELAAVPSDPQAGFGVKGPPPDFDPAAAAAQAVQNLAVNYPNETGQQSLAVQPGAQQQQQADPALAVKPQQVGPTAAQQQQLGLAEALKQSKASISEIYDNAAKKMADMYKGPSTGELLMQAGTALMQPTESGRFTDALANAAKTVPAWYKERREAANELGKSQIALDLQRATALGGLDERYITQLGKSPTSGLRVSGGENPLIIDINNPAPTEEGAILPSGEHLVKHRDGSYRSDPDAEGKVRIYLPHGQDGLKLSQVIQGGA